MAGPLLLGALPDRYERLVVVASPLLLAAVWAAHALLLSAGVDGSP